MVRAAALAIVVSACGCTAVAGLSEFAESPCEGPCVDAAADGELETSVDAAGDDATEDTAQDAREDSVVDSFASDGASDAAVDSKPIVDSTADVVDASTKCSKTASAMVSLSGFSIDRTEVTNAQYAAFLATSPSTAGQPSTCAWNTSYVPAALWPAAASDCDKPVVEVDWCDAVAYCAWVGKRLCGHPLGGAVPYAGSGFSTAASDAWFAACSSNGANAYPYPGVWVTKFCVDASYDAKSGSKDVGSVATCQPTTAPYKGVFDLVGNVAEWEDSCDKTTGAGDHCRTRGGSYQDDSMHALCAANANAARNATLPDLGFRCCSK